MRDELRRYDTFVDDRLLRITSELERKATEHLKSYLDSSGRMLYRSSADGGETADGAWAWTIAGFKTGLRTYEFIRNSRDSKQLQVFEALANRVGELWPPGEEFRKVTESEDAKLFDWLRFLAAAPSEQPEWPKLIDQTWGNVRGNLVKTDKPKLKGDLRHTIFAHAYWQLLMHAQERDRKNPPGNEVRWLQIANELGELCAEELYRQISLSRSGAQPWVRFDYLAFSIAPAVGHAPPEVIESAIEAAVRVAAGSHRLSMTAYHRKERDSVVVPLFDEALGALAEGSRRYIDLVQRLPGCIRDVLAMMATRLDFLKATMSDNSPNPGWGHDPAEGFPESWPTLAVGELARSIDRLARLVRLRTFSDVLRVPVEYNPQPKVVLEKFRIAPFNLANMIEQHFVSARKAGSVEPPPERWNSAIVFGPPGTGKTNLIKAIAAKLGWKFMSINPADLALDGPDDVVARADQVFAGLAGVEETVILFDEFDWFVAQRGRRDWASLVSNSMLPMLQRLRDEERNLFFVGTNHVDKVDVAARRSGRFDAILPLYPPAWDERREILETLAERYESDNGHGCGSAGGWEALVDDSGWATFGELEGHFDNWIAGNRASVPRINPTAQEEMDVWAAQLDEARPSVEKEKSKVDYLAKLPDLAKVDGATLEGEDAASLFERLLIALRSEAQ